jgi:hypothetical protein
MRAGIKASIGSTAIGTLARADQVYDDEARNNLLDQVNRIASNLGVDEAAPRRCRST